jgi:hypothetical protein
VDPRVGLDDVEKRKFLTLPGLELRPIGRPARSQSPYRLRYPGSCGIHVEVQFDYKTKGGIENDVTHRNELANKFLTNVLNVM